MTKTSIGTIRISALVNTKGSNPAHSNWIDITKPDLGVDENWLQLYAQYQNLKQSHDIQHIFWKGSGQFNQPSQRVRVILEEMTAEMDRLRQPD